MKKTGWAALAVVSLTMLWHALPPHNDGAGVRYVDDIFPDVQKQENVRYLRAFNPYSGKNEDLHLDAYWGAGDGNPKRRVIVFAHPGGFFAGDKQDAESVAFCEAMARKGWMALAINYRLVDFYTDSSNYAPAMAMAAADMRAAVRYIRKNASLYPVDPYFVVVAGISAGGGAALGALYDQSVDSISYWHKGYSSEPTLGASFSGPTPVDVTVAQTGEPSAFLAHGTADERVPYTLVSGFWAHLTAAGIPNKFLSVSGAKHSYFSQNVQAAADSLALWIGK